MLLLISVWDVLMWSWHPGGSSPQSHVMCRHQGHNMMNSRRHLNHGTVMNSQKVQIGDWCLLFQWDLGDFCLSTEAPEGWYMLCRLPNHPRPLPLFWCHRYKQQGNAKQHGVSRRGVQIWRKEPELRRAGGFMWFHWSTAAQRVIPRLMTFKATSDG